MESPVQVKIHAYIHVIVIELMTDFEPFIPLMFTAEYCSIAYLVAS